MYFCQGQVSPLDSTGRLLTGKISRQVSLPHYAVLLYKTRSRRRISGRTVFFQYIMKEPNRLIILSLDKMVTPFYPANPSQAAGGGEKCIGYVFSGAAAEIPFYEKLLSDCSIGSSSRSARLLPAFHLHSAASAEKRERPATEDPEKFYLPPRWGADSQIPG